ncbi:MAG: Na+/H+ antiporter subunit E [Pseudomonadota bacterium]
MRIGYLIALIFAMVVLWLGLSGHYTPLILSLGGVSIGLSALLAARLGTLDREGAPYIRIFAYLFYWVWLIGEIIKANVTVIRACLRADLDIDPALVKVKTRCSSDLARTLFANSITLTPGTVTVEVEGDNLLVHALYERDAGPGAFDEMDRRAHATADGASA